MQRETGNETRNPGRERQQALLQPVTARPVAPSSGLTTGTAEAGAQCDRAGGSVQAADQLRMRSAGSHVLYKRTLIA